MRSIAVVLFLFGAIAAEVARAGDIVVIANPGVQIAAGDVKDVFTGEKQFAGAVKLVPVDNAAAQAEFLARAIHTDATKYGALWAKKGFRDALSPPAVKSSDAETIEFVKRTPGGVGYVGSSPSGVTVVGKF